MTLRAVYHNGAFMPQGEHHIAEGTEALVVLDSPANSESDSAMILKAVTSRMARNPLPLETPRLTRDQMHERY